MNLILHNSIEKNIFSLRGVEVILDRHLAILYSVETRVLKQAVKRNMDRFPDDFMFQLTEHELDFVVSQSVIPSKKSAGGSMPFAFTEQGVAMLSAVLRTPVAVKMSIQIMKAFVNVRKFLRYHHDLFEKISDMEKRQIHFEYNTNSRIDELLQQLAKNDLPPNQGIFFDGQIFDAWIFAAELIRSANSSLILIDNYVNELTLQLFSKRKTKVQAIIYTRKITAQLLVDLEKYNAQYSIIEMKECHVSHDRFLIIDNQTVYHIGASLKDLGKKWFAFSKLNIDPDLLLQKLI